MQDEPTPIEFITAISNFLRKDITPLVPPHAAFKLRVACNALDAVGRQLSLADASDATELARLRALLGSDGDLRALNDELVAKIESGAFDAATPGLIEHLWQTTLDKLAVDQPTYASYRREIGQGCN